MEKIAEVKYPDVCGHSHSSGNGNISNINVILNNVAEATTTALNVAKDIKEDIFDPIMSKAQELFRLREEQELEKDKQSSGFTKVKEKIWNAEEIIDELKDKDYIFTYSKYTPEEVITDLRKHGINRYKLTDEELAKRIKIFYPHYTTNQINNYITDNSVKTCCNFINNGAIAVDMNLVGDLRFDVTAAKLM